MAIVKYREGTLDGFKNGFDRSYKLRFYSAAVLSETGSIGDFTEATGTNYSEIQIDWVDATVSWDVGESKYKAVWAAQVWTDIASFNGTGWYIVNDLGTFVFSAEAVALGTDYSELSITPTILLG